MDSYLQRPDMVQRLDALREDMEVAHQEQRRANDLIRQRRQTIKELLKKIILDNGLLKGSWRIENDRILHGGRIRLFPASDGESLRDLQYVLSPRFPEWLTVHGDWENGTSIQLWMGGTELVADNWATLMSFADENGIEVLWDREKLVEERESLEREFERLEKKKAFIEWLHI